MANGSNSTIKETSEILRLQRFIYRWAAKTLPAKKLTVTVEAEVLERIQCHTKKIDRFKLYKRLEQFVLALPELHPGAFLRPSTRSKNISCPGMEKIAGLAENYLPLQSTAATQGIYDHSTSDHPLPCHAGALTRFIGSRTIRPTVVK